MSKRAELATIDQNKWLKQALGIDVEAGASSPPSGVRPQAAELTDDEAAANRKTADTLAVVMHSGEPPPALQKAVDLLEAKFPGIQSEMTDLMKELDNDDLGAIDRAKALSRLDDLRQELGGYMAAVGASLPAAA